MKLTFAKYLFHVVLLCGANGLLTSVDAAPLSFGITDLGAGTATGINDLGQVVGQSSAGAPYLWSSGTGGVNLTMCGAGPFGRACYDSAVALGINNRGQIVGSGGRGVGDFREDRLIALRWDRPDTMVLLPRVIGAHRQAFAINDSGVAVGGASGGHNSNPIYWEKNAHIPPGFGEEVGGFVLPVLGFTTNNGPSGGANAINDAGVIAGRSSTENSDSPHATLWRDGVAQEIGLLSGDFQSSAASGINNKDEVVGTSVAYFSRAFLWTAASGIVNLNPDGDSASSADAINDDNWIVGIFGPRVEEQGEQSKGDRAALWRPNSEVEDLNSLVDLSHSSFTHLTEAVDINALGQIVGKGMGRDGLVHAFLLTPVPEMQT